MTPDEAILTLESMSRPVCKDIADVIRGLQDEAKLALAWTEDSSLERWFPFSAEKLEKLRASNLKLTEALKLVLLFHSGAHWNDDARKEWAARMDAIGHYPYEATTKNLCDAVRAALKT